MPYIIPSRREALKIGAPPEGAGELNFQVSKLVVAFIKEHGMSYKTINDIVGALEGAKLEFYRRVAVPYENAKLASNGDVYDFDH